MENTLNKLLITAFCLLMPGLVLAAPITTQTLTILGGSGVQGAYDAYTEYYNPATATWSSAVLTGGTHPWGLVSGTNSWLNYKASSASDPGCTDENNPCKYLYRVRFSAPSSWTSPTMTFQLKADNAADVRFNNTPVAYVVGQGSANADLVFSAALQPGVNTLTFEVSDWGGYNGFNYRIDMSVVSSGSLSLIPATPPPPPPPLVDPNTKALTIYGGTGVTGQNDLYTEYFDPTLGIWQQAFLAGVHPWGLLSGTSSWLNYRPDLTSDVGCNDPNNPCKYLYRVRFTTPSSWTNPKMALQMKVDNAVVVRVNGTQVAAVDGQGSVNTDLLFSSALLTGTNTITFEVADFGSLNGFNYRIDMSVVSTTGTLGLVSGTPPPPPPPPPTTDPNTKYLTILGGSGTIGQNDGYAEWYNPYTQAWQPAVLAGVHPWGLLPDTTSWVNFRSTLASEDGCNDPNNPCKYLYRVRFNAPTSWTNPKMTLQMRVDNTVAVSFNNTPVTYIDGRSDPFNADVVFTSALLPGINTITFEVSDYGSYVGFNYRIDLSVVSTSGSLSLVPNYIPPPPPPPPPPPTPVTAADCKKDGWTLLVRADRSKFKNQGDCVSYYETLKRVPVREDQCKNYTWMVLTRADGTTFKNQGDCMQYINTGK